jgi:streptomycin 6-kinase
MQRLPADFTQRIVSTFGEEGDQWLRDLSSIINEISRRWSLTFLSPFDNLSYNFVTTVLCADGSEAVLKLGVPNRELSTEIEALRLMDGKGVVQLIKHNQEMGALLLEFLKPGKTLFELEADETATSIAARVMKDLWISAPEDHAFPTLADWAKGFERLRDRFEGGTGPFSEDLVERAEKIYLEFMDPMSDQVVLHGDLHHWNILAAEREPWLAIDPKGVIGEPAYEVGAWLRNPYPEIIKSDSIKQITERRISQFSEILSLDKTRLLRWGFAQAVLSAWWSYEDHAEDWKVFVGLAQILGEML